MSPILGIYASSNQGQYISYGSYESIATVTVGAGGSSSVSFSSIPSTYKHLQIRAIARVTTTGDYAYGNIQVGNGSVDTGSNYSWHVLLGEGVNASASANASQTNIRFGAVIPSNEMISNNFGRAIIDVLDYADTNKYKTFRTLYGQDNNGTGSLSNAQKGVIALASGNWRSTSAINTITLAPSSDSWAQYSSFALYGVKG